MKGLFIADLTSEIDTMGQKFFLYLEGVTLGHVRGAEKRPRRTFWLGAISPPFGLVQRPSLAHFNRSDTVDILSITFYSFILGDLDPNGCVQRTFRLTPLLSGVRPRAQGRRACPLGRRQ